MWIRTACWIILISMHNKESVYSMNNDLFNPIVEGIASDKKMHQVILLMNNISIHNDAICQKIIRRISAISIDFTKMMLTKDNRSLSLPILQRPTSSTMYVIFVSKDDNKLPLENIKTTLNTCIRVSPISTRPKCLVVYYSNNISSTDDWKNLLLYAWSLRFLDFTISVVTPHNPPVIFTYNPFTNLFYTITLTSRTKLFPYKLHDMHGYPMKVPAFELPPYLYIKRNSEGHVIDMGGMSYNYCRILSETLNFTVQLVTGIEHSLLQANFSLVFEKLYTSEIDMLSFPFNVRSIMYNFCDCLLMGKMFLNTNYVFVVPIISILKVDIPLDVIVFVPLFVVIVIVYEVLQRLLNFPKRHWQVCKIFQILLGVTVPRKPPRKLVERIVYFSLIVLSMKYSIDTLTKIMDIKLLKGEVAFDTLDEIAESSLPVYTLDFIIQHTYGNNDDEVIDKLRRKTFPITDIFQCFYQMVDNKSCMCITPHSGGAYVAKQFINEDGKPSTKVARPSLYDDMAAFAFERTSPFARRFDEILQRIVESGISDSWSSSQQYTIKSEDFDSRKPISENIFLLQLCAVLSVGYVIACLAFVGEIAYKCCCGYAGIREFFKWH